MCSTHVRYAQLGSDCRTSANGLKRVGTRVVQYGRVLRTRAQCVSTLCLLCAFSLPLVLCCSPSQYQGFNARIQNISIHFRNLLEPHESALDEQQAEARIAAASMFAASAAVAASSSSASSIPAVLPSATAFSSSELSSMDASGSHSYFLSAMGTMSGLQLHREFLVFLTEIRPLVASFPLLLKNKSRVMEILLRHARVPNSPAQKEVFTLISVLARDLRAEFYEFLAPTMH